MGSEEPAQHAVIEEAVAPLRVPATSTATVMATTTTTTTTTNTREATVMHAGFFSPHKRKRDTPPLEVPETPWRLQHSISHDDDDDHDHDHDEESVGVELVVEYEPVASGQVSPRSNGLASQLSDLNLSGKLVGLPPLPPPPPPPRDLEITMTLEEEPPAAKKVKRRSRPANRKKKVAVAAGGNGDGSDEDLATVVKRNGKEALSFDEGTVNGNGKEATVGNTRRRLRSPPLPITTDSGASDNNATADESDNGVDSDDPDQLGIGYKPTLMQRHARDRKRMQQVKEYKARVSKEAREKRSETRRSRRSFPAHYVTLPDGGTHSAEEGEKRKVVHFNLKPVVVDPVPEDAVAPEVSTMPD